MSAEDLKTCSTCKEEKPRSEFNKNKNRKDGLQYQCRECAKQYYKDNPEKIKQSKKQYRKENVEKIKQRQKQYRNNLPAGVYSIKNTITGQTYIGQSTASRSRWNIHKSVLRRNKHPNYKMQEDCNKYGLDVFEFEITKEFPCDTTPDVLLEEETRMIAECVMRGESLYNLSIGVEEFRKYLIEGKTSPDISMTK
jgi:hypothetical protein